MLAYGSNSTWALGGRDRERVEEQLDLVRRLVRRLGEHNVREGRVPDEEGEEEEERIVGERVSGRNRRVEEADE